MKERTREERNRTRREGVQGQRREKQGGLWIYLCSNANVEYLLCCDGSTWLTMDDLALTGKH